MILDTNNPFVGLRPFQSNESLLFFGRSDQTLELLQRLHVHRFVAVIGSSGCGKSSLIKAGLIPSLKAGYLVDDSNKWVITSMTPGYSPLLNLTKTVLDNVLDKVTPTDISELAIKIEERGVDAIIDRLTSKWDKDQVNFFFLIDQFEELFRFSMSSHSGKMDDKAIDFVNIILSLSEQTTIPIHVVLTMRADFLGDCAMFYELPEAINKSQYLVPRLKRHKLKTVIEGPSKLFGKEFNPSLTSLLLNNLNNTKDELPILQHALMRIWEHVNMRGQSTIDFEDYQHIGGIENALSNHAEEALSKLSEDEILIVKQIFQALTEVDENGRKIRRPANLKDLKALTGIEENKLLKYINLFIEDNRSFLIVNDIINSKDKLIDISHESLIRQWHTLNKWVDEEAVSASFYHQLSSATTLYKANQREYLTDRELQIALNWKEKYQPTSIWASRYNNLFDYCMEYLYNSKNAFEAAAELAQKKKRKQRNLIIGIAIVVPLAILSIIYAYSISKKNALLKSYSKEVQEYSGKLSVEKEKSNAAVVKAKQDLIDLNKFISTDLESMPAHDSLIKQRILLRLNYYLPKNENEAKQAKILQIDEVEFEKLSEFVQIQDYKFLIKDIKNLMPNAPIENIEKFIYGFNKSLTAKSINTPKRFAAFMAVVASESEELTNFDTRYYYNAKELLEKYEESFKDVKSIESYAGNPEKIANRINANMNGNGDENSQDGWKYHSRGIMKIRFKGRYEYYTNNTDYNLLEYPDLLSNIIVATDVACYIWVLKLGGEEGANKFADDKDFKKIANIVLSIKVDKKEDSLKKLMDYYKKACNLFDVK